MQSKDYFPQKSIHVHDNLFFIDNLFKQLFYLGGPITISTKFIDGNVLFLWNGDPSQTYHVKITRDGKAQHAWYSVTGTQYTVVDALLYDSISMTVRIPNDGVDNQMTYNGIIYMPHHCTLDERSREREFSE